MRLTIAIPARNEAAVLRHTVTTLAAFCSQHFPHDEVTIVIADNDSTDATPAVAAELVASSGGPRVAHLRLTRRGKGLAIREAWTSFPADVYAFMDADLATDLAALPVAVAAVADGAGMAVGSRYVAGARVRRGAFRKLLSYGYRTLLGLALGSNVSDAPCGFKVASGAVVRDVLPAVRDNAWFFDSEVVLRAERAGFRVREIPVAWADGGPTGRRSGVAVARVTREYVANVRRLRRELGPAPVTAPPLPPTTPTERRIVWALALGTAALLAVPPTVAWLAGRAHGLEWNGRTFLSPGDTGVYLSYITQAMQGRLAFENIYTTEPLLAVPNLLWLSVGWLGAALHVAPIAAYHVARSLLIFPFVLVAHAFFRRLFAAPSHRIAGLALLLFGSGVGLLASVVLRPACDMTGCAWPIDLWVTESNAFMSMLYSPHFVASWTLLLGALLLLLDAYDRSDVRRGALSGLVALVMLQFHPFHVVTLYAVGGATLLARARSEGYRPRQWAAYAAFLLLSFPAVAYFIWLTRFTPNGEFMFGSNITLTPALSYVLLGFGAIGIAALCGALRERGATPERRLLSPEHRVFLTVWAGTQLLMAYLPFTLQRRLLQGLEFPLVALAVPALAFAATKLRRHALPAVALCGVIFLPSTIAAWLRAIPSADGTSYAYFSPDTSAGLAWLRASTPNDAIVLAATDAGNDIGGWAGRPVYIGHWANTVALPEKSRRAANFFAPTATTAERAAFLAAENISYVWVGAGNPMTDGFGDTRLLAPVFTSDTVTIYRVQ